MESLSAVQILTGDCLEVLRGMADESLHCCVTSPPYYGLRDYGHAGQIGLEETPQAYVERLVEVFREVRRVLRKDGTLWLNLGDSYAGGGRGGNPPYSKHQKQATSRESTSVQGCKLEVPAGLKPKDLIGIPWRVAFALQADGWWLRQDIIWSKPNPMPESVKDRCTRAHEYVFMLTKAAKYYYDSSAIAEAAIYSGLANQDASGFKDAKTFKGKHGIDKQRGHSRRHAGFNARWDAMSKAEQCSGKRNKRSVWPIATRPFAGAHFATMPPELARTCILAGCPSGGVVLDPFGGAGTTALAAVSAQRGAVLIELNPHYVEIAKNRLRDELGFVGGIAA